MKPTVGIAFSGSFCTFRKALDAISPLSADYHLIPIFSDASFQTDSRFGDASDFRKQLEEITGNPILHTLTDVEPIGPKKLLDLLVIAPCTGNTLGKLANGIADSPVSFACKAHLRGGRPVLLAISTNDGLAGSAENIGRLLNRKNYYFVPFGQDDPVKKPYSLVAEFSQLSNAIAEALNGRQLQPILIANTAK